MIGVRAAATAALAGVAFAAAASVAAAQTLARQDRPAVPSAHGDVIAFSRYDARRDVYRLVTWRDGRERRLPVRARSVPFDVDLGLDREGRLVAVYSRCRRESFDRFTSAGGRGCRLYRYSFATRREYRLLGVAGGGDEFLPAIWRDRLVFARRRSGARVTLFLRRLGSARTRRLRGGTRLQEPLLRSRPVRIDVRGERLAFLWTLDAPDCAGDLGHPRVGARQTEVWLSDLGRGGRQLLVDRACDEIDPIREIVGLGLAAGRLLYAVSLNQSVDDGRLRVYTERSGDYQQGTLPQSVTAIAASSSLLAIEHLAPGARPAPDYVLARIEPPALEPSAASPSSSTVGPPTGTERRTYAQR